MDSAPSPSSLIDDYCCCETPLMLYSSPSIPMPRPSPVALLRPLKILAVIFTFSYFISFANNTHIRGSPFLTISRKSLPPCFSFLPYTTTFFFIFYFRPEKKTPAAKKKEKKKIKLYKNISLCGFEMLLCSVPFVPVCVYVCMKWKNNAPKNGILIFLQYIFISI